MNGITSDHEGIKGQVKFQTKVKIIAESGEIAADDISLNVKNANTATVYVTIGTNFKNYNNVSGDDSAVADERLAGHFKERLSNAIKRAYCSIPETFQTGDI
jgi:alpha-L-fucosidase 2